MGKRKRASDKSLYAVIHITRKQIWGEDRTHYEDMLGKFYGAGSSSDLSYREKLDFIDRLKAIRDGEKQPPINRRKGPWANKWAIKKIAALVKVLGWDGDQRLNGFIKRQTGKSKTAWMLTKDEATKVIIGLMKMISKGNRALYNWLNSVSGDAIDSTEGRNHINKLRK